MPEVKQQLEDLLRLWESAPKDVGIPVDVLLQTAKVLYSDDCRLMKDLLKICEEHERVLAFLQRTLDELEVQHERTGRDGEVWGECESTCGACEDSE